ncbi:hypothetical protein KY342_05045 [Candidatus Woesearchaeota archaeon]|nr:hypothetical protein [Candidatus Woesearchaeota archaeon]
MSKFFGSFFRKINAKNSNGIIKKCLIVENISNFEKFVSNIYVEAPEMLILKKTLIKRSVIHIPWIMMLADKNTSNNVGLLFMIIMLVINNDKLQNKKIPYIFPFANLRKASLNHIKYKITAIKAKYISF